MSLVLISCASEHHELPHGHRAACQRRDGLPQAPQGCDACTGSPAPPLQCIEAFCLSPQAAKTALNLLICRCLEKALGKEQGWAGSVLKPPLHPHRQDAQEPPRSPRLLKGTERSPLGGPVADGRSPAVSSMDGLAAARALKPRLLKTHPLA